MESNTGTTPQRLTVLEEIVLQLSRQALRPAPAAEATAHLQKVMSPMKLPKSLNSLSNYVSWKLQFEASIAQTHSALLYSLMEREPDDKSETEKTFSLSGRASLLLNIDEGYWHLLDGKDTFASAWSSVTGYFENLIVSLRDSVETEL